MKQYSIRTAQQNIYVLRGLKAIWLTPKNKVCFCDEEDAPSGSKELSELELLNLEQQRRQNTWTVN